MLHQHWLRLLILTSSAFLLSCKGTLPIRPEVDICMVSVPDSACLCAKPDGTQYQLKFADGGCDKHVAIDPAQFGQLAEYVLKLEEMAHKGCGLKSKPATEIVEQMSRGYKQLEASR